MEPQTQPENEKFVMISADNVAGFYLYMKNLLLTAAVEIKNIERYPNTNPNNFQYLARCYETSCVATEVLGMMEFQLLLNPSANELFGTDRRTLGWDSTDLRDQIEASQPLVFQECLVPEKKLNALRDLVVRARRKRDAMYAAGNTSSPEYTQAKFEIDQYKRIINRLFLDPEDDIYRQYRD